MNINLDEYFKLHPTRTKLKTVIEELYSTLKKANAHFGYRTVKAIVDYVEIALKSSTAKGEKQQEKILDIAVFSKVLPKLRGQQSEELEQALGAALKICEKHNLKQCVAKIQQMRSRLHHTGLTRFWS